MKPAKGQSTSDLSEVNPLGEGGQGDYGENSLPNRATPAQKGR